MIARQPVEDLRLAVPPAFAEVEKGEPDRNQRHRCQRGKHQPALDGVGKTASGGMGVLVHLFGREAMRGESLAATAELPTLEPVLRLSPLDTMLSVLRRRQSVVTLSRDTNGT